MTDFDNVILYLPFLQGSVGQDLREVRQGLPEGHLHGLPELLRRVADQHGEEPKGFFEGFPPNIFQLLFLRCVCKS